MIARAGLLALAAATAPTGCDKIFGDGSHDAHQPGTDLGSFTVDAAAVSNTCGDGALGQQAVWQFTVKLARDPGVLYWNNGQAILSGTLAPDGMGFTFETSVLENMRDPNVVGPLPCSIERRDHAAGTLDAATGPVGSFAGQLSYTFAPTEGSTCDDLVSGPSAIVAALPCGFTYEMKGRAASSP